MSITSSIQSQLWLHNNRVRTINNLVKEIPVVDNSKVEGVEYTFKVVDGKMTFTSSVRQSYTPEMLIAVLECGNKLADAVANSDTYCGGVVIGGSTDENRRDMKRIARCAEFAAGGALTDAVVKAFNSETAKAAEKKDEPASVEDIKELCDMVASLNKKLSVLADEISK